MGKRRFRSFSDALNVVEKGAHRDALRNFNFMNTGRPPSVGELAEKLGFDVRFRKLPKSVSARLEPDSFSENGFVIEINEDHPRTRQRFSALHEIAHFYLHDVFDDPFSVKHRASLDSFEHFYSNAEEEEEREANSWVEAIVFGQNALVAAASMHVGRVDEIAKQFGLSEQAVRIAMKRWL